MMISSVDNFGVPNVYQGFYWGCFLSEWLHSDIRRKRDDLLLPSSSSSWWDVRMEDEELMRHATLFNQHLPFFSSQVFLMISWSASTSPFSFWTSELISQQVCDVESEWITLKWVELVMWTDFGDLLLVFHELKVCIIIRRETIQVIALNVVSSLLFPWLSWFSFLMMSLWFDLFDSLFESIQFSLLFFFLIFSRSSDSGRCGSPLLFPLHHHASPGFDALFHAPFESGDYWIRHPLFFLSFPPLLSDRWFSSS